jgi:hypothetical protein
MVAKNAENQRRREFEQGFNNIQNGGIIASADCGVCGR